MIEASKKDQKVILDQVPCIHYPVQFQNDKKATIQTLINLDSKVNAITPAYAKQLGLQVQTIDIKA